MPTGDIGNLVVQVKQEGAEQAAESIEEVDDESVFGEGGGDMEAPTGGDGGGALQGIVDAVMGMSSSMLALVAGIGAVVGILASMEPIQKLFKGFLKTVQAFFTPLAMMLIKLLSPVLRFMIKLLPLWFSFFQNPAGAIKSGVEFIWNAIKSIPATIWNGLKSLGGWILNGLKRIPAAIWNFVRQIPQTIWGFIKQIPGKIVNLLSTYLSVFTRLGSVFWNALQRLGSWIWGRIKSGINFIKKLPSKIWDFMKKIPGRIASSIKSFLNPFQTGGFVSQTQPALLHQGETVLPPGGFDQLLNEIRRMDSGGANIQISGGLETMIDRVQKNPNYTGSI